MEYTRSTTCDLPAAHSMDTRWFAVDDDGCVAVFDSGEAGAVPEVWSGGQGGGYLLTERLEAVGLPVVLPDTILAAMSSPRVRWREDGEEGDYEPEQYYNLLVRLAYPRLRDLLPHARLLPVESGTFAHVAGPIATEPVRRLLARGLIQGAWAWFDLPPASLGLYHYPHADRWENWTSGPYMREAVPARPLQLHDLPESLQQMAVHLPKISFSTDEALQPVEILPCRSWQRTWVGLDGEQHEFVR